MSDKGTSVESLERSMRLHMRQVKELKNAVNSALAENPSEEVAFRISAFLDEWKANLLKVEDILNEILEATDFSGKSTAQIEEAVTKLAKPYNTSVMEYTVAKGKVSAMHARLSKPAELTQPRRSVDTSFNADGSIGHVFVKLPDIPVPKFDGKIKNFTEWHSLFSAMIDKNDALKPVQKLYFLKQALIGEAATLLKDHTLQDGAYEQAIKYIEERYYNRRTLIATHFHDLLELPAITFASLRESLDCINAIIRGLKVCKLDFEKMSPLIAFIVVRKLPDKLRTDWENSHFDYSTYPSFEPLATFLQNRCFAYESLHPDGASKIADGNKNGSADDKKKQKTALAVIKKEKPARHSTLRCFLCEKSHYLSQCEQFLEKPVADRFAFVCDKKLCTNCFRQFHTASNCNSSKCKKCGENHNTLLHCEISGSSNSTSPAKKSEPTTDSLNSDSSKSAISAATTVSRAEEIILLPSAVVLVSVGSRLVKAHALIDQCSEVDLVSETFARQNRFATKSALTSIEGVNPDKYDSALSIHMKVKSCYSDYELELDANIIGHVLYQISSQTLRRVQNLDPELQLADCQLSYSTVDILIGGKQANKILTGNKKFFGDFSLQESMFGWVAEGPLETSKPIDRRCCNVTVKVEQDMAKFFEVEEVYPPSPVLSMHEKCEAHFMSTYKQLENGKFQARLPPDQPISAIANTYKQASSCRMTSV